jgi:hypothetical protein
MKPLWILLFFCFFFDAAFADDGIITFREHAIYKKVEGLFDRIDGIRNPQDTSGTTLGTLKARARRASISAAESSIEMCTGVGIDDELAHYKGLMGDMADQIRVNRSYDAENRKTDMGTSENGYYGIRTSMRPGDAEKIDAGLEKAIAHAKTEREQGRAVTWDGWKTHFESARIAMLAYELQLGWTQEAARASNIKLPASLKSHGFYGMGPLGPDGFGLELSGSDLTWGRAYKVVAGSVLSHALWEKGYSGKEIAWAVEQANLLYETTDLLYDHLGKKCDDVHQCPDNESDDKPAAAYDEFVKKARKMFSERPKYFEEFAGTAIGAPALGPSLARAMSRKLDDERVFAYALLAFKYRRPEAFKTFFDPILETLPEKDRARLNGLFEAAARDVRSMVDGAKFTADNLKDEERLAQKNEGLLVRKELQNVACYVNTIAEYVIPMGNVCGEQAPLP